MDYANLTKEQTLSLANADPEFTELLKTRPAPQYDYSDSQKLILGLRQALKQWHTPPIPEVAEKDVEYAARDGYTLRLKVFSPAESPEPSSTRPVIILYHGGGFTIGSPESLAPICRVLVQKLNAICITPSYRQGPEDPFPAGILDGWDAFTHITSHMADFGATPTSGIIIGGVSAGGKIAIVVSHMAHDHSVQPRITGVWLAASSCVHPETVPEKYKHMYLAKSQDEVVNAPVTALRLSIVFQDAVKPDIHSELSSPLNWHTGHKGQPRTFLQVCGMDIVRDDSLIYEKALREEAGVETMIKVYPGWPHIFFQVFPQAQKTKEFYAEALMGLGWLLHGPS